tara:strand:+ start:188 stop:670 length:483 start_codon:yes stop_codon:yes gene_type:complete
MKDIKKSFFLKFLIILSVFFADQLSKYYVVSNFQNQEIETHLTSFLNIYLIWNNGIAFGLLGFEDEIFYNLITFIIVAVLIVIFFILIKTDNKESYFFAMIFGGACGNLIDRIRYSSVPDFIDFHIYDFHWFIFNVADIFITLGVFCLIIVEILFKKKRL